MADLRITELPSATTPLNGSEPLALVQGGVTKQAPANSFGADVYSNVISVPYIDLGISEDDDESVKKTAIASYLEGYNKSKNETLFIELFNLFFDFKLDLDWAALGVSDGTTFITWFESVSDSTITSVGGFRLNGSVLQAELNHNATSFTIQNENIASVENINALSTLNSLSLINNNLSSIPDLTDFVNLNSFNFSNNQLASISGFDLPSLTTLNLSNNQLDLTGYANSEAWANNLTPFTNPCEIIFTGNLASITGTNLEAILLTKNATITA